MRTQGRGTFDQEQVWAVSPLPEEDQHRTVAATFGRRQEPREVLALDGRDGVRKWLQPARNHTLTPR